jgi:hypothetical protein
MYTGLFRMNPQCRHCGLRYEREPGYFLGSIYVNYGLTAITTTITYVVLRFGAEFDNNRIAGSLAVFCVAFPLFFFRYARAYWLAMDLSFDRPAADSEFEHEHD